jgi:hypothetical protein
MEGQALTRRCPACGATCSGAAQICYQCKKVMDRVAVFRRDPGDLAALGARLDAGDLPHHTPRLEQPGRFRLATKILTGLVVLCMAGCAVVDEDHGLGFVVIASAVLLPIWLALAGGDLLLPSARRRDTAERAVRCFVGALRASRWAVAHACLSPLHADRRVSVPELPMLRTRPVETELGTPAGVRRYWRAILVGAGMTGRRVLRHRAARVDAAGERVERWRIDLEVATYPAWVWLFLPAGVLPALAMLVAMQTSNELGFEVLVYEHHGQWWIERGDLIRAID